MASWRFHLLFALREAAGSLKVGGENATITACNAIVREHRLDERVSPMTTPNAAPSRLPLPEPTLDDTQPVAAIPRGGGGTPWLVRIPLLLLTGLALLLILAVLFVAAHEIQYSARIYPGVSTYGIDLGGLTHAEAVRRLDERFVYDERAIFTFRDGTRFWQMTAGDLGVSFDLQRTADAALLQGRSGNLPADLLTQADMWFHGRSISPLIVYDQTRAEALLAEIAAEIDRPVQDATLTLTGTTVVQTESQTGRALDIPATLATLRDQIMRLQSGAEIPLVIQETPPTIWSAEEAAGRLRAAVAGPLALYADASSGGEAGPWVATPEAIAAMLVVERVEGGDGSASYDVHLNPEQFQSFLSGIAPQLETEPVDARFHFDPESGQLQPIQASVDGRRLDIETTLAGIEAVLFEPAESGVTREVPLAFKYIVPVLNSGATAAELGIVDLVGEATTYYMGSSAARQANIVTAAERFDGIVIGPGEEFSFNQWLGDVSPESGFEESFIIYGGRTIKGVGGGVCQVSTTVFQAAFYAGLPILERYPHGYRVGYYEYGEGAGMDATVYSPIVDFRFLNDLPSYLLIETSIDREHATLTFRLYGTSVGRTVTKVGPRITNVVPHGDTIYEENPELAPGQTRQIEWAVDGSDVAITRQVWRNGELEQEDHFFSHYLPWNAVVQVAPGGIPAGAASR